MESLANQFFIQIYYSIDILLIILARFIGFIVIIPVLSGASIPMISRLGLSLVISYLAFVAGVVTEATYYDTVFGYGILIATEFFVGFILAYVVYVVFSVAHMVGQLIDFQIGFAMVNVLDPVTQIQVPIVGNLLFLLMGALFITTGGIHAVIAAMFHSYYVIPVGTAGIAGNNITAFYMLHLIVQYFNLAVRIALPVVGVVFLINIALGILVKAVPQMNVFVVGIPIKLLVGLVLLLIITPMFSGVYDWLFNEAYRGVINVMRGMAPQ